MDYSNPILLKARLVLGKKLGLLRPIVRLSRLIRRTNYEAAFDAALLKCIRPGWTVWDVGANEGYYTRKFSEAVVSGTVVAFEPSPRTFERLKEKFSLMSNVRLENVALADKEEEVAFFISDNNVEDSLFRRTDCPRAEVKVRMLKGDSYLAKFPPDVIKMDIEGFELDALRGMCEILASQRLKFVFIEVHFSILADRDQADAPIEIVDRIEQAGMQCRWLDPSHLMASRVH